MKVFVEGMRSSTEDWARAQQLPSSQIPPLSVEDRVALGASASSEEQWARSLLASEYSGPAFAQKARRLGLMIEARLGELDMADARVERVTLVTYRGKFEVEVLVAGAEAKFQIDEKWFDAMVEGGEEGLELKLRRIVERNTLGMSRARAS